MQFPDDSTNSATVPVSIRLPENLLSRIDSDVETWNKAHPTSKETRSERIIYLLSYAYKAGSINQFVDFMQQQYLQAIAATPQQLAEGVSTFNQVNNLINNVNEIDDKLEAMAAQMKKLTGK